MLLGFALSVLTAPLGATISVPLDYARPEAGRGHIYYELGARFDRKKPTLFVVADGQQFYVRKGRMSEVQKSYGAGFNVVGVVGRADSEDIAKAVTRKDGTTDWLKAWRFFNSDQWVDDLEEVRRKIVGNGKIVIYGASGGAMLSHQYLAKYGSHVLRAITPAAVMPEIEAELHVSTPSLWSDIGTTPGLRDDLQKALALHAQDRADLVMTLQRQHFFVAAEKLPAARADLIKAIATGDSDRYEKAKKEYQVDAINGLLASRTAIPIRVREYEFLAPKGLRDPSAMEFNAEYEAEWDDALPLIKLRKAGLIGAPHTDFKAMHTLKTDVLVLAGLHDEAVDYRTSISLAARYPFGHIVVANDNHVFTALQKAGLLSKLEIAFLSGGFKSSAFQRVAAQVTPALATP